MDKDTISVMGNTFWENVPFDLTGYKKVVRTQDFPLDHYDVGEPGSKTMEIVVTNDTNYLNDVEFWSYFSKRNKSNPDTYIQSKGAQKDILFEAFGMIDSIEVFADTQRLFYIKDARYLLSIINQRKLRPCEEQLCFKTEDVPEYTWTTQYLINATKRPTDALNVAEEADQRIIASLKKWTCAQYSYRM